jgi:hypothetical protein
MVFRKNIGTLAPGKYQVIVSGVSDIGESCIHSPVYEFQVSGDTVPPPPPSAPTVTQMLGLVMVKWDGKTADNRYYLKFHSDLAGGTETADLAPDFDSVNIYAFRYSTETGGTETALNNGLPIGFITTPGGIDMFTDDDLPLEEREDYYNSWYSFRFKAVDNSGNESEFGGYSTPRIKPDKLTSVDVELGDISFDEIGYKDNGNFVYDGSFENTKKNDERDDIPGVTFLTGGFPNTATNHMRYTLQSSTNIIYLEGSSTIKDVPIFSADVLLARYVVRQVGSATPVVELWADPVSGSDVLLATATPNSTTVWRQSSSNNGSGEKPDSVRSFTNATNVSLYLRITGTVGQQVDIDSVEVRKVIGTALIQDAAIDNAKIQNATIQSAKIANLEAGLIRTGEIGPLIDPNGNSVGSVNIKLGPSGKIYAGNLTGTRVTLDVNGLSAYENNDLAFRLATSGPVNAYFKGEIIANSGLIGGWSIQSGYIINNTSPSAANIRLDSTGYIKAGTTGLDQVYMSSTTNIPRWRFWAGADTPLAAGQTDDTAQAGAPFRIRGDGYFLAKAGSIAAWNIAQKDWGNNGDGALNDPNWIWSDNYKVILDSSGLTPMYTYYNSPISKTGFFKIHNLTGRINSQNTTVTSTTAYFNVANDGTLYSKAAVLSDLEIRSTTFGGDVYPLTVFAPITGENFAINFRDINPNGTNGSNRGWVGYGKIPGSDTVYRFGLRGSDDVQIISTNGDLYLQSVQTNKDVKIPGLQPSLDASNNYVVRQSDGSLRTRNITITNSTSVNPANNGDIVLIWA